MKKYSLSLFILAMLISTTVSYANSTIYTDDVGRMHFMGKGGYSGVRNLQMQEMQAGAVNQAAQEISKTQREVQENIIETQKEVTNYHNQQERNVLDVIKEKDNKPVSSFKSSYTSEQRKMDASSPYGYGNTNLPDRKIQEAASGVNNSKTMYTDDIGRIHFFGKGNIIRE